MKVLTITASDNEELEYFKERAEYAIENKGNMPFITTNTAIHQMHQFAHDFENIKIYIEGLKIDLVAEFKNKSITDLTNEIFDASGLNNEKIANRISLGQTKTVSRQAISNYRNGSKFLRYERLIEIADLLDVRINFTVEKIELFL
jgi:transcriptional regulator with XRE-family HTH domain